MLVNPTPYYLPPGLNLDEIAVVYIARNPGMLDEKLVGKDTADRYAALTPQTPVDERLTCKDRTFVGCKMHTFIESLGEPNYVFLNVLKCATAANAFPPLIAETNCKPWLQQQLEVLSHKTRLYITFGTSAAKVMGLRGEVNMNSDVPVINRQLGRTVVHAVHPAAFHYMQKIPQYEKLREVIRSAKEMPAW